MPQYVYVLNQVTRDGVICTSVFKHFETCVRSVIMELKEHSENFSEDDEKEARKELEDSMYYEMDNNVKYYIEECLICEDPE